MRREGSFILQGLIWSWENFEAWSRGRVIRASCFTESGLERVYEVSYCLSTMGYRSALGKSLQDLNEALC